MTRLTEGMVIGRTRATDLNSVRKLNCWGSELSDVSLVRQMANVEVLSLSVNKITTLADFGHCPNLSELYVRKNMIKDLSDIVYLKELPKLRNLWLEDNPCAVGDRYRLTVLKYLPNLKKLDNIIVQPDEVRDAMLYGNDLEHPSEKRQFKESPSSDSMSTSPSNQQTATMTVERDNNGVDSEGNVYSVSSGANNPNLSTFVISSESVQERRTVHLPPNQFQQENEMRGGGSGDYSPTTDEVVVRSANRMMARRSRSETPMSPTVSEKDTHFETMDQTYDLHRGGGGGQQQTQPIQAVVMPNSPHVISHSSNPPSIPTPSREFPPIPSHPHSYPSSHGVHSDIYVVEDEHDVYRYSSSATIQPHPSPPIPPHTPQSAVHPTHHKILQHQLLDRFMDLPNKPYPVRPKNRNSNILSAVLCLIKELDCASLEVVEVAVKCRMDELDD